MLNSDLIPFLIAMFFAINMGGSGISPSFSCTYGSNILSKNIIPGLFGSFVFLGAIIAGGKVIKTISKGIISEEFISFDVVIIILSACTLSLLIANLLKIPQSTSQATVGSLIGIGLYFSNLNLKTILLMLPMWFILPIIAFILTYYVSHKLLSSEKMSNWQNINDNRLLKYFVIATSCYVAFSIGSNNVANAAGPLVSANLAAPLIAVLIIAPCFGIGSSILGPLTLETTGKKITSLNPVNASIISFISGSLLLSASYLGIPQSLVQLNVAAIMGVGCGTEGIKKIIGSYIAKKTFIVWIIAPTISFMATLLLCFIFVKR